MLPCLGHPIMEVLLNRVRVWDIGGMRWQKREIWARWSHISRLLIDISPLGV